MKINLLVILLLSSCLLNAQIKKGAVFIGGDVSVNYSNYHNIDSNHNGWKNASYNFSPSVGWAVKDNVVVGGRLFASFSNNSNYGSTLSDKGHAIGAGVWMRKYVDLGRSFYLFAEAGLNGQSTYRKSINSQAPDYHYREKGFVVSAFAYPGVSYQVRKSIFLEAALYNLLSLGYSRTNVEQQYPGGVFNKGSITNFNLASSFSGGVPLQVGIRWMIPKK